MHKVRDALLARGVPDRDGLVPFDTYRPFDRRWLYWELDTKLLDERSARLSAARVPRQHVAVVGSNSREKQLRNLKRVSRRWAPRTI